MSKFDLYLNDILRAIRLIERSTKSKNFKEFESDKELIDATSMRLQIIGESISKLDKSIKEKYKEVNWQKYLKIRNIISHAYFTVNPEILWSIVKSIPDLKKQIFKIKKDI